MNANAKRLRPEMDRHETYYFEDGNIILAFETENIMFRLYRGLLAHHSQVFYDMLSIPQVPNSQFNNLTSHGFGTPSSSRSGAGTPRAHAYTGNPPDESQEVMEGGVPIIRLTDRAVDFTYMLDVIMGITPVRPSIDMIEGALRISGKYIFDGAHISDFIQMHSKAYSLML